MRSMENIPSGFVHLAEDEHLGLLRKLTQDFVRREFPKYVVAARQDPKIFPAEFMRWCAKFDYLGMDTPEKYGGIKMTPLEQIVVMEELARGDAGLSLNILVQNSLTAFPIALAGTDDQKSKYLPSMARGDIFACFGLTEPNIGSDAKSIGLKASWDERKSGWVANGAKRFITGAVGADLMVLAARTGRVEERDRGISLFLAEMGSSVAGVQVANVYEKFGQPGSQLCEVFFDDYFFTQGFFIG